MAIVPLVFILAYSEVRPLRLQSPHIAYMYQLYAKSPQSSRAIIIAVVLFHVHKIPFELIREYSTVQLLHPTAYIYPLYTTTFLVGDESSVLELHDPITPDASIGAYSMEISELLFWSIPPIT
jgi:hypothetical protein